VLGRQLRTRHRSAGSPWRRDFFVRLDHSEVHVPPFHL